MWLTEAFTAWSASLSPSLVSHYGKSAQNLRYCKRIYYVIY